MEITVQVTEKHMTKQPVNIMCNRPFRDGHIVRNAQYGFGEGSGQGSSTLNHVISVGNGSGDEWLNAKGEEYCEGSGVAHV